MTREDRSTGCIQVHVFTNFALPDVFANSAWDSYCATLDALVTRKVGTSIRACFRIYRGARLCHSPVSRCNVRRLVVFPFCDVGLRPWDALSNLRSWSVNQTQRFFVTIFCIDQDKSTSLHTIRSYNKASTCTYHESYPLNT